MMARDDEGLRIDILGTIGCFEFSSQLPSHLND